MYARVSVLYREPKLLKDGSASRAAHTRSVVSVLYREPKLLKDHNQRRASRAAHVSVLYREPKLLKAALTDSAIGAGRWCFSALP